MKSFIVGIFLFYLFIACIYMIILIVEEYTVRRKPYYMKKNSYFLCVLLGIMWPIQLYYFIKNKS